MRTILYRTAFLIIAASIFTSCKKGAEQSPLINNLPQIVSAHIPSKILDTLTKYGTVINKGLSPPNITGNFLVHPLICFYDNSGDYKAGGVYSDYTYTFTNQNNNNFTVQVNSNHPVSFFPTTSPNMYISGSGSSFTVFEEYTGSFTTPGNSATPSYTVTDTAIYVGSGKLGNFGINNFQVTEYFYSQSVNPLTNEKFSYPPAITIFYDGDGYSDQYYHD